MVSTYQLQEDYESNTEWYTLEVRQSEVPLYGSSRLGLHLTDRLIQRYYNNDDANGYDDLDTSVPTLPIGTITSHSREVGHKAYELPNHLGNVLATVSDRKWPVFSEPKPGKWQFEHFQAELLSASEYYPFGMEMPGRIASSESYRYGFQGQEKDDEIKGPGNSINYKFRMHDPRMGRFLSVDPLADKYPYNSSYAFSENDVIRAIELEGAERNIVIWSPWITKEFLQKIPNSSEIPYSLETYQSQVEMSLEYLNGKINEPEKNGGLFTNDWHTRTYTQMSFPDNRALTSSIGFRGDNGIINVYGAVTGDDGVTRLELIGRYGVDKRGKNPRGFVFTTKHTSPGNNWSPTAEQLLGVENIDYLMGVEDLTEVFPFLNFFREWVNGYSDSNNSSDGTRTNTNVGADTTYELRPGEIINTNIPDNEGFVGGRLIEVYFDTIIQHSNGNYERKKDHKPDTIDRE